jgi:hypothetical protein
MIEDIDPRLVDLDGHEPEFSQETRRPRSTPSASGTMRRSSR